MCVCIAAAASFLTPVVTPANMMIMGPAGCRFGDYRKLGLPLIGVFFLVAVGLLPPVWSFQEGPGRSHPVRVRPSGGVRSTVGVRPARGGPTMPWGPVEWIVVEFPGSRFRGEIVPELAKLVDTGTIHIIDLLVVHKDADGTVHAVELDALDPDEAGPFEHLDGEVMGLLSHDDITLAAAEHRGAARLGERLGRGLRVRGAVGPRPGRGLRMGTPRDRGGGGRRGGRRGGHRGRSHGMRSLGRRRRGPGLLGTVTRTAVIGGTATAVAGRVAARQHAAGSAAATQTPAPGPAVPEPEPSAAPAVTEDLVDQIKRLGDLVSAGLLTDEEFAVQKARLLGM